MSSPEHLPSLSDLRSQIKLAQLPGSKTRTQVVIALDKQGLVVGYAFVKLPKSDLTHVTERIDKYMKSARYVYLSNNARLLAKEREFGFRFRFVPMHGYVFDSKKAAFVKR